LLTFLVLSLLAAPCHAKIETISKPDKKKIVALMKIMYEATKACHDQKLKVLLGSTAGEACYEQINGKDATLKDLFIRMYMNVNGNRVRMDTDGSGIAGVTPTAGLRDLVIISKDMVTNLTDTDPGGLGKEARTLGVLDIGATLLNEFAHVFQKPNMVRLQRCDAEKDSDTLSLKFLCRVLDAVSQPDGTPHGTIAAINGDAQAIGGFGAYLTSLGLTTAMDLSEFHREAKKRKEQYKFRRDFTFDDALTADDFTRWEDYYRSGYNGVRNIVNTSWVDSDRGFLTVIGEDGLSTQTIFASAGELYTQALTYLDDAHELVLAAASVDASGARFLRFWTDTDADGLPELPAVSTVSIPSSTTVDPGLQGVGLYYGIPRDLSTAATDTGLLVHDLVSGAMHALELDTTGLPAGPAPLLLFEESDTSAAGGHSFFRGVFEDGPTDHRFVFRDLDDHATLTSGSAVWVDLIGANPTTGGVPNFSGTAFFLAQALAPLELLWLESLAAGELTVEAYGVPGATVSVHLQEGAASTFLGIALIGADGSSGSIPLAQAVKVEAFYLVEDGTEEDQLFLAEHGTTLDFVFVDEDGDTQEDAICLSVDPGRLHLALDSSPAPQDPARQHLYELVLETPDPLLPAEGFVVDPWTATNREVVTLDNPMVFTLLPGSSPPLYVQSIVDLDGDTNADEAVLLFEQTGFPGFVAEIIDNIPTAPFPIQQIPLPPGFEPAAYSFQDVDSDTDLDVCIPDHNGGPSLRLMNDGFGNFTLAQEGLVLDANPDVVSIGQTLTFTTTNGTPNGIVLLFVTEINSIPFFLKVIRGCFDPAGVWSFGGPVPAEPGLAGSTITFQSIGLSGCEGFLDFSTLESVSFQ
jgi:hypothetical protein